MSFLRLRSASLFSLVALSGAVACGGDGDATTGGSTGKTGAGASGSAGTSAGAAGTKAASGSAGSAGSAGTSAKGGSGGAAAGATGTSGSGGTAGSAGTAGTGAGATGANAGAAGIAGSAGSGGANAGTSGAAGTTSAGAGGANTAGTSGAAGAGGGTAKCADTCKAGACVGETCCAVESVCGAVCCPSGDVCSFDKCITPGKACAETDECGANEFCDFSLGEGDGPGNGGAAGKAGAGGAAGKAGAGGAAGKAGAAGSTGKAGAAGAAGKAGAAGAAGSDGAVCQGGVDTPAGKCLPRPPACGPGEGGGTGPITCVQACSFKPPTIPFKPAEVYSWGTDTSVANTPTSIMMAPIVLQLDDDDCDGKVTERDIPDIAFATFSGNAYNALGPLHVVSVEGGTLKEKWVVPNGAVAGRSIAGGNFDGKPGNEIVACTLTGIVAYEGATGKVLWTGDTSAPCQMPAIADLDQDGAPEIIVEGGIFRGTNGTRKAAFDPPFEGRFAISDIDGDGLLDIVGGRNAYHGDGKRFATLPATDIPNDSYLGPAVADLDGDGVPEVLNASFTNHTLAVWHIDPATKAAKLVRPPVDINATLDTTRCGKDINTGLFRTRGGGPVTAGDFDNDGHPDVALAGGLGYVVLNGAALMDPTKTAAQTLLWSKATQDCSSAQTGSSLFDFDGDGKAEVVYADELELHVYDGKTGTDLFNTCSTNGTLYEYPLVADIDNDGHADLLLVSNAYSGFKCDDGSKRAGLRVFSDPRWVRTRRIWNQHAYNVTNVNEDGSIPVKEASNWKDPRLNNFRQNKQPGQEFAAPDVVVSLSYPKCGGAYGLTARVTNIGEASVPAGVTVGFYLGAPSGATLLGKGTTDTVLYPAQSANVTITLASPPADLTSGQTSFYAIVDDTNVPHPAWTECRTDNNIGKASNGSCGKD